MALNASVLDLPPLPSYTLKPLPSLLPGMSDTVLSLVLPIVAYWVISGFFHVIDTYDLMPQYRLHTPAELMKRNHATQWDVFRDVVVQQIIQTIFGISVSYLDPEPTFGKENYDVAVWARRIRVAQRAIPWALGLAGLNSSELGLKLGGPTSMVAGILAGGKYPQLQQLVELNGETVLAPSFASWELQMAKIIYWAAIPVIQLVVAILIMDTWQYFLHRGMHMNQWLYSKLISSDLAKIKLT
jgi:sphinganine C4-monooxygenase